MCVPLNSKAQFDLATKEIIAFCSTLGYNDVMFRCDNEPSLLQLQRLAIQARQKMGLRTQACTPSAYEHGNALAENAVQRIRSLACSITHSLQMKLSVTVGSSHALWSWCMRHAAWILNRYNPHQGLTAYEVVYGKPYGGQICEYGEPVLGFAKVNNERQSTLAQNVVPRRQGGRSRQLLAFQRDFLDPHKVSATC